MGGDGEGDYGHTVWRWSKATQNATRIAGRIPGIGGKSGDKGEATNATMKLPWGLVSMSGKIFVSEAGNADIRVISGNTISTFYGGNTDDYGLMYPRKLHKGAKSGTLLWTISGLGADSGRLLEVDASDTTNIV